MVKYIDGKEQKHWSELSSKLKQISELTSDCQLLLMLEMGHTDGKALAAIDNIESAVNGLSYRFTPQSEWIGGNQWRVRAPHIAQE